MRRLMTIILVAGIALFGGIITAHAQNAYGVSLQNVHPITEDNIRYITGIAVNNSQKTYAAFLLTYDLFDDAGTLVGNAQDGVQNFRPGQKWRFKMIISDDSSTQYRVSGMDGD